MDRNVIKLGSYKGNALVVLGADRKFPFQFGAGKASLLLRAMDEMGLEEFREYLFSFIANNSKNGSMGAQE